MIKVGVAQIPLEIGNRAANFRTVEEWMKQYCKPSDLTTVVVLPEFWDVGHIVEDAKKYGDPNAEQAAKFLGELAVKYNVWFAGGSVFATTAEGAMNRAMVVNPKGEYVAHYDKVHLIPLMNEDKYLKGGRSECHFDIDNVDCSSVICYDIRFCEWMRLIAVHGAEIFFISAEWPTVRIDHWIAILKARAIENMMYVVACNRVGKSRNNEFGGHSLIIDPWGKVLFEGSDGNDGAFVELDIAKVKEIRDHLKVFDVRHPELYKE